MSNDTHKMTLTEFLLARIEDDEASAQGSLGDAVMHKTLHIPPEWLTGVANRMLDECAAKRQIVRGWGTLYERPPFGDENARQAGETAGHVFRCLALPYADHPDYREEWKP